MSKTSDDSKLRVPRTAAELTLTVKGSRFIARAQPASSPGEARAVIEAVKAEHPDATHVVYAFRVGGSVSEEYGMSDAGEPKGTAGRPTLEVLKGSGIADVVLTTVRYFGGTKLGTGGLVRAYTEAAQAVLEKLPTRPLVAYLTARLTVTYEYLDPVQRALGEHGAELLEEEYGENVLLRFRVEAAQLDALSRAVQNVSRGTLAVRPEDGPEEA